MRKQFIFKTSKFDTMINHGQYERNDVVHIVQYNQMQLIYTVTEVKVTEVRVIPSFL